MEVADQLAPPVVAVMVVHEPGSWFDDVLDGLAAQDYPNLRTLLLVAGDPGDVAERVRQRLANAFVRTVEGNPGFARVANQVLHLVEGDNGFFCFLHDDVALDPDAIRLLVEELYRSNAGIVGPKLVDWDRPSVLQHVGSAVDRFGEVDPVVEPGETDQEQHDAVRDVFALPSACLLVRADLFRSLGGFDTTIEYHGDDLDLCWRAHLGGARVLVVPPARGRHRERLAERRPDLAHLALRERHRMRTVLTLTGARRLPLVALQLVLVTLAEFVVSVFTGSARRGVASLGALATQVAQVPAIFARRRAVAPGRLVPDGEVAGMQARGSARFTAYLRTRDGEHHHQASQPSSTRSWRERAGAGSAIAWLAMVTVVLIGSRHLIGSGVPRVGEFLPFDDEPLRLLRAYTSGWNPAGVGATAPVPTGLGLIGLAGAVVFGAMGLLHTAAVVGTLLIGAWGMWRLARCLGTTRARLVATVVYLALPLMSQLMSMGHWGALAVAAALPWSIDSMRRFAGLESTLSDTERLVVPSSTLQVRLLAGGSLVAAITVAFEPTYWALLATVTVVLALATLAGGAPLPATLRLAAAGATATVVGLVLNVPWSSQVLRNGGWAAAVGPPANGGRGLGVTDLLSFDVGNGRGAWLALALYVPVLGALVLARGSRFGWAVRAACLVVVFAWLAVLDARGSLPLQLPEPGIVLAPVAVGCALAAATVAAAFSADVRGGDFGWRQPLALLCGLAAVVGVLPGTVALQTGRWDLPSNTMIDLLGQFPRQPVEGDYRVLWLGDQRLIPVAARAFGPGVAYALTDGADLEVDRTWATPRRAGDDEVERALGAIATGSTTRAGRLLAPFAVRYVVVPLVDGAVSTESDPLPVPAGLLDALGDQLDLAEAYSPPAFVVFENRAWLPMRSVLTADGATASRIAGAEALAQAELSGATAVMVGADHLDPATVGVPSATVHLAVPFDRNWRATLDGSAIDSRPAFGSTMAFDVATPGTVQLDYVSSTSRRLIVLLQVLLWLVVVALAAGARLPSARQRSFAVPGLEPVLSLGSDGPPPPEPAGSGELVADEADEPGAVPTSGPDEAGASVPADVPDVPDGTDVPSDVPDGADDEADGGVRP